MRIYYKIPCAAEKALTIPCKKFILNASVENEGVPTPRAERLLLIKATKNEDFFEERGA